jgi:predicted acylesterase/phospholipase RssA
MEKKNEKYEYNDHINARTLCACSALPFIEGTVEIDGVTYCEGALVDTVNFESLLDEHPDLEEIWVSRIVDSKQIRKPENLHDALANLCQLFAATVGEDDVRLFKYHVTCDRHQPEKNGKRKDPWNGIVVEIHVPGHINFKWNHSNLENGRELGKAAAHQAFQAYKERKDEGHPDRPLFINDEPEKDERWQRVREYHEELKDAAA